MACCVISLTALTDLYRTIYTLSLPIPLSLPSLSLSLSLSISLSLSLSLYSDGQGSYFEVDSAGPCIATSARKLPPWQSPSSTCSRCPRNARLIMASVMILFIIRSKPFLQKVASVAIACSWTRSMR